MGVQAVAESKEEAVGVTRSFASCASTAAFLSSGWLDGIIRQACAALGLDEDESSVFSDILAESVGNAVLHGNLGIKSDLREIADGGAAFGEAVALASIDEEKGRRQVEIRAEASMGGVAVSVQDEGDGFDPSGLQAPKPNARHGRGLWLLGKLGVEMSFEDGGRRFVGRFERTGRSGPRSVQTRS